MNINEVFIENGVGVATTTDGYTVNLLCAPHTVVLDVGSYDDIENSKSLTVTHLVSNGFGKVVDGDCADDFIGMEYTFDCSELDHINQCLLNLAVEEAKNNG